ncbi:MAG: hypothetical protein FWE39_14950, partial [Nocardiaceae bacterium]|nr:hypothetical protein [Nocardiaceae bacterium]
TPVARHGDEVSCPEHGVVPPLWRPALAAYDAFVAHLEKARGLPSWLPWPLLDGWRLSDFAVVEGEAALTTVTGPSPDDGDVELVIVTEETGVGLGERVAGTGPLAARRGLWGEPPSVRLRVDGQPVPLWPVPVVDSRGAEADEWDRTVLAGESAGRWLWLVVRPASAALLLAASSLELRDAAGLGMSLVELPFGGAATRW